MADQLSKDQERFGLGFDPNEFKQKMTDRQAGHMEGILAYGHNEMDGVERKWSDYHKSNKVTEISNNMAKKQQRENPDNQVDFRDCDHRAAETVDRMVNNDVERVQQRTRYMVSMQIQNDLGVDTRGLEKENEK